MNQYTKNLEVIKRCRELCEEGVLIRRENDKGSVEYQYFF